MSESLNASPRYAAVIYRYEPETRWLRRHILRRKTRSFVMHTGAIDAFTLERNLNGISNASFVLRDPMEYLTKWGPNHPSYDGKGDGKPVKPLNGSGLAPLWAFCVSLIVAANIPPLMIVWAVVWSVVAYRYMAKSRKRGTQLTNGEGSSVR